MPKKITFNESQEGQIIKLFHEGAYYYKIAQEFGVSSPTIINFLKSKGLTRSRRKYQFNENYLDNIDSQKKAYVLGFIYADGCNNIGRNSLDIELQFNDKDQLTKIRKCFSSNHPIRIRDKKRHAGSILENSQHGVVLSMVSKHLSDILTQKGSPPNKGSKLVFPDLNIVPKQHQRHFIRGYFDGDGTVNPNGPKFGILGTISLLRSIESILITELGFRKTKLSLCNCNPNNCIRCLERSGRNQFIKFRDWLYKGSTIELDRKKQSFYSVESKLVEKE